MIAKFPVLPALVVAGTVLASCSDQSVAPTAVAESKTGSQADHGFHQVAGDLASVTTEPFTYRASIDAYRIHQLPDFMIHSTTRSDIVMQRSVFNPGAGMWHTHPGPSFVYVIEGQIKLERFTAKGQCVETPVHSAGAIYFEVADEVHRAVVVSETPAVVLVTRFNIPLGSPITIPADDPGC